MAILVYTTATTPDGDWPDVVICHDRKDAEVKLNRMHALLVLAPANQYLTLIANAQACHPPIQVLVLASDPHGIRAELREAGTPVEVLRLPVRWPEIARRLT